MRLPVGLCYCTVDKYWHQPRGNAPSNMSYTVDVIRFQNSSDDIFHSQFPGVAFPYDTSDHGLRTSDLGPPTDENANKRAQLLQIRRILRVLKYRHFLSRESARYIIRKQTRAPSQPELWSTCTTKYSCTASMHTAYMGMIPELLAPCTNAQVQVRCHAISVK